MPILLEDLNLRKAERLLCNQALNRAGSIVEAAHLLGITRHALKRRMIKHRIEWPPQPQPRPVAAAPREHRPPMAPQPVSSLGAFHEGG
ncbi:MAG: helix-turn-helix domain-containing protein [Myxococcota bacterium]